MNIDKTLIIILSSIFINNIIFGKIIGLLDFFEETKKLKSAISIGITTTIIMTLSSVFSWIIHSYILIPFKIESFEIISYVLIIIFVGLLVKVVAKSLKITLRSATEEIGVIANSAVLGVLLINHQELLSFSVNLISSFAYGIGYLLALLITAGIHERLEETEVPQVFKGIPITMISMGIVAMIFMGFFGIKG